ncbi:MAG: S8 family serine peptidase [Pirellulales bacterium]|nr:S8 family serine peptidase [Pirellulales bacterium]
MRRLLSHRRHRLPRRGSLFSQHRARSHYCPLQCEVLEDRRLLDAAQLVDVGNAEYVPGEILIKLRELPAAVGEVPTLPDATEDGRSLASLLSNYSTGDLQSVFTISRTEPLTAGDGAEGDAEVSSSALSGDSATPERSLWYRLELVPGFSVEDAVAAFAGNPNVEYAGPNHVWRPAILPTDDPDPKFNQNDQWHLFDANVTAAWEHLQSNGSDPGGLGVVVAVIDTGVDYYHEEVIGNMWINAGEIPGNGVDDDGNGYIDDIHGVNVVEGTPAGGQGDPSDSHGHGTHVAGIVAATSFNDVGGVGVAYNARIMAINASAPELDGGFSETDVVRAIYYAVDNGADVINMSFGGTARSLVVEDALEMAANYAVLVAAAGNSGLAADERPFYPAALPWVLGVVASDADGDIASFSNYDDVPHSPYEYEVAAPGTSIYSGVPGGQYAAWSGTSMAAPVVSGVAALVRSLYPDTKTHSAGFIQSQIAGTLSGSLGGEPGEPAAVINAVVSMTPLPSPDVSLLNTWLFDDASIAEGNDGDGRFDSHETIHLGVELINRGAPAGSVSASLRAVIDGGMDNPNVLISVGTVDYGLVPSFAVADNGLYWNNSVPVGVSNPFVVSIVDPTAVANGDVVEFELTTTSGSGTHVDTFQYVVQRGTELPPEIVSDTSLTADTLWILSGDVSIAPGATLTIEPGTQVQWGFISDDPFDPGQHFGTLYIRGILEAHGTADAPVSLFPLAQCDGQTTRMIVDGGSADISYATVRNPELYGGVPRPESYLGSLTIDHSIIDWTAHKFVVEARSISHTIIRNSQSDVESYLNAMVLNTVLFDGSYIGPNRPYPNEFATSYIYNSTFLQNSPTAPYMLKAFTTYSREAELYHAQTVGDSTYVLLRLPCSVSQASEQPDTIGGYIDLGYIAPYAEYFGGHVVTISDDAEQQLVQTYFDGRPPIDDACNYSGLVLYYIGLEDSLESPGEFTWHNDEPLDFTNWAEGAPPDPFTLRHLVNFGDPWEVVAASAFVDSYSGWLERTLLAILELPANISESDLQVANTSPELWQYLGDNVQGPYQYNAFLNPYWDVNIDHWMRVTPRRRDPYSHASMTNNYWGTDDTTIIDHMIDDFRDDVTNSRVDYGVPPSIGFSTTYPFVQNILIDGQSADSQPTVGAGSKTFTLSFNRDMDTSIHPYVTFGPADTEVSYTDFAVRPLGNGWIDPRTWEGEFTFTPTTGDGYQYLQMSGAVAADDPWLVTGLDVARFRFNVETMGVGALTLHASGAEGQIELTWKKDDFDLLAGYNVYRSPTVDGTYEKINDAPVVADPEREEVRFLDTDVEPAVTMFYRFTVLQSDLTESTFSNVASAAAEDTIPPILTHEPITNWPAGLGLRLTAVATDNLGIESVKLYYRAEGTVDYTPLSMVDVNGNHEYATTIPSLAVQPPGIEYYVVARDEAMLQDSAGNASSPFTVLVHSTPSLFAVTPHEGSHEGGETVTLTGTLFQEGATVEFGGVEATDINVVSTNQITVTTPMHYPALIDVMVINPDYSRATLLNGYRFVDRSIRLSIATTLTAEYGETVAVPIYVENASGLHSVDIVISYDSAVLFPPVPAMGSMISTSGWFFDSNTDVSGVVSLSMAGVNDVSGDGELAIIQFYVVGSPSSATDLTIDSANLNNDCVDPGQLSHGLFTVTASVDVSGSVTYFNGVSPVPEVLLSLIGNGVHTDQTDATGVFSITDVLTGTYTLTPTKDDADDHRAEIESYDAVQVLQEAVGIGPALTSSERLAADVNRDGVVNAWDAFRILEYWVSSDGLGLPFAGAGRVWDFAPSRRGYALLNTDQINQDFIAILIGDVTGNWMAPAAGGSGSGDGVRLWLPTVEGDAAGQVTLPLRIERNDADVLSAGLVFAYDASLLSIANTDVTLGNAANGMAYAVNTGEEGIIRVGLASAQPLAADGVLLEMTFTVDAALAVPTVVDLLSARINEGAIGAELLDGLVVGIGLNADFDTDGDVDGDDLGNWQTGFGSSGDATLADGDADGDTDVDGWDFLAWQLGFGTNTSSGSAGSAAILSGGKPSGEGENTSSDRLYGIGPLGLDRAIQSQKRTSPAVRKGVFDCVLEDFGNRNASPSIEATGARSPSEEDRNDSFDGTVSNQTTVASAAHRFDVLAEDRLRSRTRHAERDAGEWDKGLANLLATDIRLARTIW